jgi:hypothetical protein
MPYGWQEAIQSFDTVLEAAAEPVRLAVRAVF